MKDELARWRDFGTRYTAAWCSGDAARVAAFFSPNGTLSVNRAVPAVGRSAIRDVVQGYMEAIPDLELIMDDIAVQGDGAVYHWTLKGTNTGPGGTGHRVRISGLEVWKSGDDGLIEESQGRYDQAAYQRQLERGVDESS